LTTTNTKHHRSRLRRITAQTARWLHIYLSMGSFALVLFFAATGLTLNHPDWFAGRQKTTEHHGVADKAMLRAGNTGKTRDTGDADGADKLGLVEMLRTREHVHGAVSDFRVDDAQISISFRAAGYTADVFIDRDSGKYDLTEVQSGLVAVMNDLHKGRDTGRLWSVVIDVSAVALVLLSLTGLILMWFVYKRRTSGFMLAGIAAVALLALWYYVAR
jgi:hypothetical protein